MAALGAAVLEIAKVKNVPKKISPTDFVINAAVKANIRRTQLGQLDVKVTKKSYSSQARFC